METVTTQPAPNIGGEPALSVLERLLRHCPACKQPIAGHSLAELGCVPVGKSTSDEFKVFYHAVLAHDWKEVLKHRIFKSDSDNLFSFLLRCSVGTYASILIRDPLELIDGPSLFGAEAIPAGGDNDPIVLPINWSNL